MTSNISIVCINCVVSSGVIMLVAMFNQGQSGALGTSGPRAGRLQISNPLANPDLALVLPRTRPSPLQAKTTVSKYRRHRRATPAITGKIFPPFGRPLRHAANMRWLVILILAGLGGGIASAAPDLVTRFASAGKLILTPFAAAPFPHSSRTNGHRYREEFFPAAEHYSDPTVALFVPQGFQPAARVDFVIHFHGWRNSVSGTLTQYQLVEQFVASRRNAVLVIPEGPKHAPDSSGGKLEEPGGFARFMAEALAVLQREVSLPTNATVGRVILSGHSGGYQVVSAIAAHGGLPEAVREVWLFDALYAQTERFLAWADRSGGRLVNIYTDAGGTKQRTQELIAVLAQRGAPLPPQSRSSGHRRRTAPGTVYFYLHGPGAHPRDLSAADLSKLAGNQLPGGFTRRPVTRDYGVRADW
jgi:hypothetical protein